MAIAVNIVNRLENYIIGDLNEDECWILDKATGSDGYHILGYPDKSAIRAHKLAWEAHHAMPKPEGMVIMHTCDNPRCVNPWHLRLGTYSENTRDAVAKGRWIQGGLVTEHLKPRYNAPRINGRFAPNPKPEAG